MDRHDYLVWTSVIDSLSAEQRAETQRLLAQAPSREAVLAVLEERIGPDRSCPHCSATGAVIRGRSDGLRRYFCKTCRKTFNALTGTPLARLRLKEHWTAFAASLGADETVVQASERCGVSSSTAFRWRHRFLRAVTSGAVRLRGVVEADETFVLASRKGERRLDRKPRKRGGKAAKRGRSDEQTPVLVAVDRSGTTVSAVLAAVSAAAIRAVLEPVLDRDALLVTDGCTGYARCATELGVSHVGLDQSAGERRRGELHIQTVNSRHERLKGFLRRHRGVATRYLDNYLRWLHLAILPRRTTARSILAATAGILPAGSAMHA